MALGDHLISRAELAPALEQQTQGDKDSRIFIRADKSVSYQDLITLMDMLRDAGYLKVALISLDSPAS